MKKTVSVNIKGYNFLIEEDAYELLSSYLEKLKHGLKNEQDAKEILEDIEIRIAELFAALLNDKKQVIEIEEVQEILNTLGNPSQILDEEENTSTDANYESEKDEKRIYRDTENASIAGVCKGISTYLNIDVVIVRAVFVLIFLFAGFGIPLYIILWIIIPKAETSIDRLKMKGKAITLENVKGEFEEAGEKLSKSSKKFAKKINEATNRERISQIGVLIRKVFGIFLLLIGFSSLFTFLVFIIGSFQMIPAQTEEGFLSLTEFSSIILSNEDDTQLMWITIFLTAGSWILFFIISGFKFLFDIRNRWIKLSLAFLIFTGIIGVSIGIYLAVNTGRDFAIEGEIEKSNQSSSSQTLHVESLHDLGFQNNYKIKSDGQFGVISIEKNKIRNNGVHIEFIPSKDSLYHIHQLFSSHGFSHRSALTKAEHIEHNMELSGDTLRVATNYAFPISDKMRDQEVYIQIEIPAGKECIIDDQIIHFNPEKQNSNITLIGRKKGLLYPDGKFDID
jgi:phage shock protein PspC (stress-responsive transcriptional regulator)